MSVNLHSFISPQNEIAKKQIYSQTFLLVFVTNRLAYEMDKVRVPIYGLVLRVTLTVIGVRFGIITGSVLGSTITLLRTVRVTVMV